VRRAIDGAEALARACDGDLDAYAAAIAAAALAGIVLLLRHTSQPPRSDSVALA